MNYINTCDKIFRQLLFLLPPETAHNVTILLLKKIPSRTLEELPNSLNINFFGQKISNPVGLAAGFDKNAEVMRSMRSFGFGFLEVGTVTKYPQYGNKKPRIIRLIKERGLINKLGFNNKGIEYLLTQINNFKLNNCVFGVNIGKNNTSGNIIDDYVDLVKKLYGKSSYIAINISSPNTPHLRNLHNKEALSELLQAITITCNAIKSDNVITRIMLKISPDIDDQTKENIAELVLTYKIDGLIVSNTTISRDHLYDYKHTIGGVSGTPLFKLSTELLQDMYTLTKGKIFIIGCGGISNGSEAYMKIKSGASAVQLYTAFIYQGPQVINTINLELAALLRRDGFVNITDAVGCNCKF
ncbi:quinone-dependent dihydroorotate dehydrogenase [Wolbachia endosymbiont of Howardula sp.]|uniref:quinone-dependent dihydroorotate dehydrogenase n=1 Tax=Wolbachia endosymbiont of Howardula sp. TaxID=2916816 RepID=UPI00217E3FDA|nr:quinone-dependent dihydroorotate dehydrogenase [Wolbachia endosymbiont of Howardula sp.]UWI83000.1 quinone-dependent dihydroorotate dehydrogenase [Wolbachia endosymbiont of Howardula sp.]